MLSEVFYVSRSTHPRGHLSDLDIIKRALVRNEQLDLTGCLLRGADWFAQSLEGPADALSEVFASIQFDRRHTDLSAWRSDTLETRRYPEWRILMTDVDDYRSEIEMMLRSPDLTVEAKQAHVRDMLDTNLKWFNPS